MLHCALVDITEVEVTDRQEPVELIVVIVEGIFIITAPVMLRIEAVVKDIV
jgi:hypothetical protein